MKVKVAKWGNSLGVRLPRAAAERVGVTDGSELDLALETDGFRLRKQVKTSAQRLAEMLDEIKSRGLKPPDLVDWGADRGSEIIDDDYSRGLIVPSSDGAPVRIVPPEKRDARSRRR